MSNGLAAIDRRALSGQPCIIEDQHTFLYHVNTTAPLLLTENIDKRLDMIKIQLTKYKVPISKQIQNKLDALYTLNLKIQSNLKTLYNTREKRGLIEGYLFVAADSSIDGIGTAAKYLFGTMDSNDRDIMTKYIENLKSDQKDIRISLSKQQTVIKEMVSKYTETFETIEQNHNNIIKRINDFLSGETVFSNEISELLFLNIISDEIYIYNRGIQLEILLDVVSNLEIALSFGKTHYLHNSIFPNDKILIILEELKTMYNSSSIANFSLVLDYYSFFSTDVTITREIVLFKIYVPIISCPYHLFHLIPIYKNNYTLIPETPYLLFDSGNYWNSETDWRFLYNTNSPKRHKLINPKDRTTVYSSCIDDGLTAISNPTIIKIENCELKIDGRKFIPSQNKSTGIIFNLPNFVSFNVSEVNSQKTLQIPSMKHEDLKNIKVLTENMEAPIPEYFTITNIQGISMSLIGIVAVIAIGVSIIVWKFRQHQRFKTTRQSRNQESRNKCQDFNLESIPKQEPLFCHLRERGII
ncbi:hypothetical protein ABEB36_010883 [Hypothenemus hampei]|uniref:Envelope protein n=1 Tax=Hypothenemus hampei TaxID=57062 RepID=A0ABD1EDC1_HYPHA